MITLSERWAPDMGKDDSTWLNISYLIVAGIFAFVGYKALYTVGLQFGWSERYDSWYPLFSRIFALIIGAAGALGVRASQERREYHLAAIGEIRKVTWPSMPDTKRMTVVVVVVVSIFAVILAVFDIAWSKVLQLILP